LKKGLRFGALSSVEHRCIFLVLRAFDDVDQQPDGANQQQQWPKPEQPGGGFDWGTVQHEVAIAADQIVLDFSICFAIFDQGTHFTAQIHGQVGTGAGQGFVLAYQTA